MTAKLILIGACALLLSCRPAPHPPAPPALRTAAPQRQHAEPAAAPAARIHRLAGEILRNLTETAYQHKTQVDENRGVYRFDCSGLVAYVLKKAAAGHYSQIPHANPYRPYAKDFYDFFASLPPGGRPAGQWCRIDALEDAGPGDILAYKYTPDVRRRRKNTGHVMIITAAPRLQPNGEYRVDVIDAASTPHGNDTRAGCRQNCGVGRGQLWLGVDAAGRPTFYRWHDPEGIRHRRNIEGIAIGRAL